MVFLSSVVRGSVINVGAGASTGGTVDGDTMNVRGCSLSTTSGVAGVALSEVRSRGVLTLVAAFLWMVARA